MDDIVKIEKEPWLTKREWAAGLFLPYFMYDLARDAREKLRGPENDAVGSRGPGVLRRVAAVQLLTILTMDLALGYPVSWGIVIMFLVLILLVPSPKRMAEMLEEKKEKKEKKALTDGDG